MQSPTALYNAFQGLRWEYTGNIQSGMHSPFVRWTRRDFFVIHIVIKSCAQVG